MNDLFSLFAQPELTAWANNDNDALIPELWAREALAVLQSNMVMGNLVNRDFSSMVANFGDVVNTSRPADFSGKRKTDADNVTEQDAVSPNIPVPLDQHFHVTFVIKDGEMSKALPNLVERYLEPAARELAEKVDQVLAGQAARLTTNTEGRLTEMDKTNATDFVLDTNTRLDINRVPKSGRNLVLGPRAQKAALGADLFVSTDKRGDEGTALREASLGRVYGMDAFMDQNVSYVAAANADTVAGVTDATVYPAGTTTVIDTTLPSAGVTVGEYVVFDGDGEAYEVLTSVDDAGDADITVVGGTQHEIAATSAVTQYVAAAVNLIAGYAAGWSKEINIDGYTTGKAPQLGQWLAFGTGASRHVYTVIAVTDNGADADVLLDRPLDAALANNDAAFPGPAGGINLAFHRNAIALVNRPLAMVPADTGARSFVASFGDLSMRVTMQYDSTVQGMRVTFDLLCGVAILDDRQAVVLYS
jgi:hypothetical protein